MNILYIIGNGFDLNLGLKTSYKDFYNYYQSIQSEKPGVNKLKKAISDNFTNWSDLELALGDFTEELTSRQEFDEVFEDIGEQLAIYLKDQEDKFDFQAIDQNKFFEDLVKPEQYLPPADRNRIVSTRPSNLNWNLEIVTFNYTTIIDRILNDKKNKKVSIRTNGYPSVLLKQVEHIHGYLNNRMILGVNDLSQLKNKSFQNDIDVLEAIIKERCNKAYKHNLEIQFQAKINNATMICIFGCSIGDTDKIWWKIIGEKLKRNIPLIIFTKGEETPDRLGYKKSRIERKMRSYFLGKTDLAPEIQEKISQNIYISLNSKMFKNIYNEVSPANEPLIGGRDTIAK